MVAVRGEVIVVSPRSNVRKRFFGVKVVYGGVGEEDPSAPGDFGGSADAGEA